MLAVAFLSASLSALPAALAQNTTHGSVSGPGRAVGGFGGGHIAGGTMGHIGGGPAGGSFGRAPGIAPGFEPRNFRTPNFISSAPRGAYVPGNRMTYGGGANGWRYGDHHDRDGDRDRGRHRDFGYRSPYQGLGYGGYPFVYANSWELLPGDIDALDYGTYDDGYGSNDSAANGAQPQQQQQQQQEAPATPQEGNYRPEYAGPVEQPYDYAPPPPQTMAEPRAAAVLSPEPALTLIFNDGHREDIHNYVLTSDSVLVMDHAASGREKRIPLSSLNLSATQQAAQDAGLDFTPPA
ncbi:MAG: hypothetical protein ACLGXA_06190 [Acidobacteriota bacterium]